MVEVPDSLARSVAALDHDRVVLRIHPVHVPPDSWLVLLGGCPLLVLPIVLLVGFPLLWFAPAPLAFASAGFVVACGMLVTLASAALVVAAVRGVWWTELALGTHQIRCIVARLTGSSTVVVPLAELSSVVVEGEAIRFVRRDGEEAVIPVPDRSRATYEALDRWLGQVAERAEALGQPVDVPDAMRRLREQQTEGG